MVEHASYWWTLTHDEWSRSSWQPPQTHNIINWLMRKKFREHLFTLSSNEEHILHSKQEVSRFQRSLL